MTYFDYNTLQENFSAKLYQSKFGSCVNNREGSFDDAILACKSIINRYFHSNTEFQGREMTKTEYEVLENKFSNKLKPGSKYRSKQRKIESYNEAVEICKSILKKYYEKRVKYK